MRFLIRHLLLLGVILGLAVHGVAFASPLCAAMQEQQMTAMAEPMDGMPDCTMGQAKPNKSSAPCKDIAPGCLTMAGCASFAAQDLSSIVIHSPMTRAVVALWPTTPVLIGRNIAPDPHPPSRLG